MIVRHKSFSFYSCIIILILGVLSSISISAQTETSAISHSNTIADYVPTDPEFPGGNDSLVAFLQRNIPYPVKAYYNNIEGTVLVQINIETDGRITNPKILVPVSPSCDSACINAFMSMPTWKPGKNMGKPVRCYFDIPVKFQLVKDETTDGIVIYAKDSINDHKYDNVPSFPGGPSALKDFLQKETHWPDIASQADVVGTVLIQTFVEPDGSLTSTKVAISLYPDLDAEAMRLVQSMPKWIPAKDLQGNPVRSLVNIPVKFSR